MFIADRLQIGESHRTSEGYLAVRARAARAGIYDYLGREIDPDGKHFAADQTVKVYRPEEEVFAKDSVHSFLMKPITDDHPSKPVTAGNWAQLAKGVNAGAMRDGEFLAFDLVLMDAGLIDAVERGKRELSNGYQSEIVIESGITADGKPYDAIQRAMRGNHIAVVDKGRAGDKCRIGDAAPCEAFPLPQELLDRLADSQRTYADPAQNDKNARQRREAVDNGVSQMATKTITFDGMPIEATDASEAAIRKLEGQLADSEKARKAAETKVGEHAATIATKDGEITGLQAKLKDAEISPEKLQQLAADRAALTDKAKAVLPSVTIDGKTDAEIRAQVVQAKLGDKAPTDENGIAGAFAALTADTKAADPVRSAIASTPITVADNGASVRDAARAMQYN